MGLQCQTQLLILLKMRAIPESRHHRDSNCWGSSSNFLGSRN